MSEWKFLTLKEAELEFIDGDRGVNYPKKSELLPEGDCVFLNTGNVRQNSFDFSNLDFITKEKDNLLRNGKLQRDDIVLTTRGTVGNVALYSQEVPFSNVRINSGMVIIRVNKNVWHPYFIYLFFQSHLFKKQISRLISGSAQPQLPISILETVSIPQLTLDEQKEIVFNIKSIDQKIQTNNQINQELEAMAKTLYDYWFVQFDFPDQNGKPYKSSGGKMVYHQDLKREIPEGWGVEKLGKLIELERGVTYAKSDIVEKTTNDAIGVLRATNITGNVMDLNDLVYLTKDKINNKQIIKQNETLIVMSSGSKEHLGKNAINYYEEVIGFGAFCSKIVPKKYSTYINTFLQSSEFKGYLLKQSMGTNINNLTNSDILDCRIILPNEEILDKFENMVEKNIKLISNNYIQNQQLTQLRDWLLPMLMNGQVKVE